MTPDETINHRANGVRILLVDDYDINQDVAQQYLEHAGYQVDIAQNGRQAVDAFQRKRYDLILMDLQMPVMDGYEAAKTIRNLEDGMRNDIEEDFDFKSEIRDVYRAIVPRDDGGPKSNIEEVPIIAMSGHTTQSISERCLTAGMNDSISKPLQREPLVTIVQKWTDCESQFQKSSIKKEASCLQTRTSINEQLPIDLDRAIAEFMGEKEILFNVLDTFICRVNAQIDRIREHISHKDYTVIASEAHCIKGGAANLTAIKLANLAAELENAAIEQASETTAALVDALEEEYNRLSVYLKQTRLSV